MSVSQVPRPRGHVLRLSRLQSGAEASERVDDHQTRDKSSDREKVRKALAVSAASCKFKILVWGPAPRSGNPAAATRKQIRDELKKMGHDAFFSEELPVEAVP